MIVEEGFTKVVFTVENRAELDCLLNALQLYGACERMGGCLMTDRNRQPDHDKADLAQRLRVSIAETAGL